MAGPRARDKEAISSRAHSAWSKAKNIETKERAQLTFSTLMIYHKSMPKSKETETLIDEQFQNLVSLSTIKYDPEERIQSSIYSDTFNLTLMAAKTIQSSRLVGHVYKDPFKILFDNYSKDTKKYLFLLLEEFSSIFMAIQDINKKCQKISSLSENLITVAKNIVNEFNTKFSANFVSRGTSLFEDETVEWHRTLFEESRRYARLLMFRGHFFGTTLY